MPGDFFDSNVLLYTASGDVAKADRAEQLLIAGGTISVQVLNEIASVARGKMKHSWGRTHLFLARLCELLQVIPVTIDTHRDGLRLAERYRLSIYDGMIAAAALGWNCDRLWSDDMQHGLLIDGRLAVVNPFRTVR